MALTLEQLQAQRDKIITEMSRPIEVQMGDRLIRHRPQPDLESALRAVDAEIAALGSAPSRQFTIKTSRGL